MYLPVISPVALRAAMLGFSMCGESSAYKLIKFPFLIWLHGEEENRVHVCKVSQ